MSSLIKDTRFKTTVLDPHAPILWINKERVDYKHDYFKPLANIIYKIWEHNWTCVDCALYKKKKESILRVVKHRLKARNSKVKKLREVSRQRIPKKLLDCVPKGKNKVECIDPQFGIFKI